MHVLIGDQANRTFWREAGLPPLDFVLDDGGHGMEQQVITFEEVWPLLKDGGVYICEDTHTSYWSEYGAGLRVPGTFMEYMQRRTDMLQASYYDPRPAAEEQAAAEKFRREVKAMHFYDSMVVIEKRLDWHWPPVRSTRGAVNGTSDAAAPVGAVG